MDSFFCTAESGSSEEVLAALEALVQREVGAVIFSCSVFDIAAGQARRIYTNQPAAYPVSGLKDITPNAWTRQVLENRKTFVANTPEEIRDIFPDHATIAALGCGSVVNMPVCLSGHFLGTVNVLNEAYYYRPPIVARLNQLRAAAMLAFCSSFLTNRVS